MYSLEAMERVNNIKWFSNHGKEDKRDGDLLFEFLRRIAKFYVDKSLKPEWLFSANVAEVLGDTDYNEDLSWCSEKCREILENIMHVGPIVRHYIQLAHYVDKYPEAEKYLDIYEPFIRLMEKGYSVVHRSGYFEVRNICCGYGTSDWLEYADKKTIDISDL